MSDGIDAGLARIKFLAEQLQREANELMGKIREDSDNSGEDNSDRATR